MGVDYKNKEIELGKKIHDMLENKFCDAVAQLIEEKNFVPKTLIKIPVADFFGYNNGDKIKRFIIKFVEYQQHILIHSSINVIGNDVEWIIEFI